MKVRCLFAVQGETLVGDLFLPAGPGPHPAVVVAGPMTSVKEQVCGVYATALAVRGIAALALDHRHFGESDGLPRQYECWPHKIADLHAALDWLSAYPLIDARRLGLVGICLGAGYAAQAAVGRPDVRALGAVAGYYRDPTAMRAADPTGFDARVAQGISARKHFETTGDAITIPAAALEGDAAMSKPDIVEYYATRRAGVSNYTNAFAVMSREFFLPFDVQAVAPQLQLPVVMVHARQALSPAWAEAFFQALPAEKALHWLESASHVDFYDQPLLVQQATDILAAHLHHFL